MANILDKAIAAISPEKGYRRAVARAALSVMNNGTGYGNYGASRISRAMRSWHVGGGSAKEDIEDNLDILRKRSRDAYMGIPLATGAIKTLRTNVVGSGLVPTPQVDADYLHLNEEQTAAYSVEIWKRFRKWGGIPTGITQNVKDLLTSREVSNVFENSDFVYMLNQAQGDREILAKQLNISQQQMTYVTHSEAGEGLIFYGNVILPFIDRFPKDTELYRVMTTKPGEVSA